MTATSPTPSVVSSVSTLVRSPAPAGLVGHRRAGRSPAPLTTGRARRARRVLAARRRPADRDFRPDIEGLRALAVVAVVVYHAGLALPGGYVGVDVFLVISGFLITRQLLKSVGRGGLRALPTFYGHRVRRLLPAAVVVVLATTVAFRFVGPPLKVRDVATDALFTAFSGLNYRLAWVGTDYQHMGAAASPLQHFWSLAVEEQFYVVWPLVIAVVAVATRRRHLRLVLALLVVGVVAASGWASATLTPANAPWAYFSLHTRAWELGVGALLALAAPRLVALPRRLAGLAAWLGLAAIAVAAVRFTDATPFPGVAAWLPVGGAALVVASGCGPRVGAERLLGEPLVQCLGRVSYSWYLWHWPLLVVAPYALGHALGVGERLAVVWVSLVLAIASFTWVEQPVRLLHWPTWGWIGTGATLGGVVTACSALVMVLGPVTTGTGAAAVLASVDAPGAAAVTVAPAVAGTGPAASAATSAAEQAVARTVAAAVGTVQVPSNLTPLPQDAADSLPPTSRNGCHAGFTAVSQGDCRYGDLTAARTLVLFGDSHAEQWLPALDQLGKAQHWQVVSWTKAACPAARLTVDNPSLGRSYTECDTWRDATVARIGALHPALVVVSQSENVASSSVVPQAFSAATVATVRALRSAGAPRVAYVQDIPTPGTDLPGCVATHLDDVRPCTYDRSAAYRYPDRHAALAPALATASVPVLDPAPWLCTATRCPAVVGNVLVYRNESHLTVPFSRWLAPVLAPVLTTTGA
ncbi:acyltransferase family protein [Lapillicoccus jejuensis]|uniref:Peptidoglycan/LPS O-acetylase OafA/YrhL n=1 Tax=Lapillicoccus jejuensis TaxID=402171 RepID=A0A542E090_9MICO|nr:acyltransferase family protein [Lapillicoccus jejuensis]TQJ08758.1 peptidoglycan/LPS O-acetylase OafA/YrhL [Lapillicoccus jejuensis]